MRAIEPNNFKLNIITVSITCFLIPYLEVSTAGVHLAIEAGMSNCQEEGLERLELPGWEECLRGVDDDKERGLSLSFSCFPTEPHEECLRGIEEEGEGGVSRTNTNTKHVKGFNMNKKHQEEFHNRINMFSNHQRSVNGPVLHKNNH